LTSWATTAKPRPASPARAASMVAFSASRLVCSAIAWIRVRTSGSRQEDGAARVESAIGHDVVDLAAPDTDIEEFSVTQTV